MRRWTDQKEIKEAHEGSCRGCGRWRVREREREGTRSGGRGWERGGVGGMGQEEMENRDVSWKEGVGKMGIGTEEERLGNHGS